MPNLAKLLVEAFHHPQPHEAFHHPQSSLFPTLLLPRVGLREFT